MLPSRLSQWDANLASSRQLFWLVDLPLDIYLFYMVFGIDGGERREAGVRVRSGVLPPESGPPEDL